jgi:hypothetical protein
VFWEFGEGRFFNKTWIALRNGDCEVLEKEREREREFSQKHSESGADGNPAAFVNKHGAQWLLSF